eukprot:2345722-Pyramimonas_sp.AAC.1
MPVHRAPCMKLHCAPSSFKSVIREYKGSGRLMPGPLRPLFGRKKCVGRASPQNCSFFTWGRSFCTVDGRPS